MAEAAATPEAAPKKGGGGGLVGLILATVIAGGGGAGFGMFLHNKLNAPAEAPQAAAKAAAPGGDHAAQGAGEHGAPEAEKKDGPKISKLVPINPIVVNLAAPPDTFLRIEATVLIEDMEKGAEALAAQVGEDITAYLKTTTLQQIEGPSGFQNLREDLLDRALIRDPEHIKDLVVHGIVLE